MPLILGMFVGKYIFRFHDATVAWNLFPGRARRLLRSAWSAIAQSQVPALGYTVTYAVGNTLLTIWGMVLVILLT